jgi:hypothetical protein
MNEAMKIYPQCGLSESHFGNRDNARNASATKNGPGRHHVNGDGPPPTAADAITTMKSELEKS